MRKLVSIVFKYVFDNLIILSELNCTFKEAKSKIYKAFSLFTACFISSLEALHVLNICSIIFDSVVLRIHLKCACLRARGAKSENGTQT